eukprot:10557_4
MLLREHEHLLARARTLAGEAGHLCHGHRHSTNTACNLETREHRCATLALRRLHLAADLDGLVQRNVDRLAANHVAVHGSHGPGRLLWRGKAHESKALRHLRPVLVAHNLSRGDGSKLGERVAEPLVIDGVIEILDVQIDELVVLQALHADLVVLLLQLVLALALLLSAANVQLLLAAEHLDSVHRLDRALGVVGLLEVDDS